MSKKEETVGLLLFIKEKNAGLLLDVQRPLHLDVQRPLHFPLDIIIHLDAYLI